VLLKEVTRDVREKVLKMYQDFEPKESYQGLPPVDPNRLIQWVNSMLDGGFNIAGLTFEQDAVCHGAIFGIDDSRCEFILAVAPSYQNAGIGIQLTRIIKKVSQELGYDNIWLCVEPYNTKAKHIYSKLGFQYTSRQTCEECEMLVGLELDPAMEVPVSSIMTSDVYFLREDQTAREAISMFLKLGISGLPVVNSDNCVVGFLTESDVLESWAAERLVNEIMTRDIVYVEEDMGIKKIVEYIIDYRVKQIPVVRGPENKLVGIVTRKDIVRHLFQNDLFSCDAKE
jgi:CBS domain-containing protein/RimJ/RimL family protein N-acetyltransferase